MIAKHHRLEKAIDHAVEWHKGQRRKYLNVPYVVHPIAVMNLVRTVTEDEDVLIAALFHDVLEDTKIKPRIIDMHYGIRVKRLVQWLTDVSKPTDGNREARKAIDREYLSYAPAEAQTIKLADLIDNTSSIVKYDPGFAKVYMEEKRLLLEVLVKGDSSLMALAKTFVVRYFAEQEKISRAS